MSRFAVLALVVCSSVASAPPPARTDRIVRKIGSMKLLYAGLAAEIDPPNPVVPKNTPAGVRIVVRAGGDELSESEAIQFFGGPFLIEGEISGPALRGARTLRSGLSSFVLPLPPFEIGGDYSLSNVRILAGGNSVLDVSPGHVVVSVIEQVLVTSVTTRPLTLDELVEKGVVFDGDDVVGFEFTLAMTLESKAIHISFPVAFDREGVPVPQPLSAPLDPTRTGLDVDLPPLPTFVPVMLETADGGAPPELELPGGDSEPVRIPSVLVIPGDIGFLKQFFSAQLFVANGAPGGSGLVVRDIQATIVLPKDDSLSLPELTTGVQAGTLPILGEGGNDSLDPGQQGQAEFLVRGEKEGFHTLAFDIDAVLDGLVGGEVALKGRASGGVLVRKPFFDLTFTLPSVVRTDEEFELFVTVHNIDKGIANRIDVSFDHRALSGLELVAGAPASQRIDTLQPGELATLAYDFKALRTGQVVASYLRFDGESVVDGSVHFTLGVADGVPLSPDTLVLPASVDALDRSIVRAGMRVLGQGWSIAKAPAGTLAPGIRRIRGSVVIEKALLLAEAGLRVQLGEDHDSAVRGLLFDFYGGSPQDPGFDALLHTMAAGRAFGDTLSRALEDAMGLAGGATGYERETARLAASGPDFLTFALDSARPFEAPDGALVLSNDEGRFGVITQPTSSPYTFALLPGDAVSTRLSVTLPHGDGTFVRGSGTVDLEATDRARLVVDLFRPEELEVEIDTDGDGIFETTTPLATESLESEGPRLLSATLIGPEVYEGASAFGFHAAALFDRIVDKATASERARYLIPENTVKGAKRQLSGRVVFLTLDRPEGPYEPATLEALDIADLRGADRTERVALTSLLADPGAVVTGRVFEAGGSPASGGAIAYANFRASADCINKEELVFAEVPLGSDGSYELRYVRRDPCGSPFRILYRDPDSPDTGELHDVNGFVRGPGERIRLDLALFGRGAVSGRVFESGIPAPGAKVVVTSGTSAQSGGVAETDGDGRYTVHDVVVGPVSVKAARGIAAGANSGRIARAGTTALVDVVLDPGKIRVRGTISKLEAGVVTPLAGAQVVYALEVPGSFDEIPVGVTRSAADGSYVLEDLPFGRFELKATLDAEARAFIRGTTTPGEDRVENLVIAIAPPAELGTVRGRVILPDGSGAPGAVVSVGMRQAVAGAGGAFEIPGVPVHPGVAEVVHATTSDGKRQGHASVLIGFPGQIVENLVITLSGLGSIELTVFAQNGQPAARQVVGLIGTCPNLCGCRSALTNDLGVATFSDLPPGTHFAKAVLVGAGFIDVATGSARIEKDGDVGRGVLRFEGVGTVTGRVLLPGGIEPAPGSDVTLTSQIFDRDACELRRGVSHRGRTNASGAFAFANVHFGEVSAIASHPFADTKVGAMSVLTKAAPLDFELVLVDSTAGIVSGMVFLPDGITPAGAGVEVAAVGPLPEVSVRTGDDGTYEFRPIFPQGMYTFTATDPITGFAAREQIFLRVGADTEHEFRLKGKGTVRVRVVDAAGAPTENAYVKLSESEFPLNTYEAVLTPASQGVATFSNVFEGPFSVEAKDVFGRDGGRFPSILPGAGAEIDVEVRLNAVGKVKGRFLMPDFDPIPFGVVTLISGGQVLGRATTAGAGDVGSFVFDYVPIGALRLEAQDPLTARHGFATGELRAQDETLVLDVRAQGLGRVEGTVRANGIPQAAASVALVSGTFRASTSADDLGFYFIEGVPEGRVVATASLGNGFLAGKSEAVLAGDGSTLLLDVALRDSATVTGRVTKATSTDPAPPSIVTLSGLSTTTDPLDGSFRFERVPAGSATFDVTVVGSIDRARRFVDLPAGGVVDLTIPLNGVGAIQVQATGAGKLTLRGIGDFPYSFAATLGDDGAFFLPEVLAGPVTATLEVTGPPKLFGTASGLVRPDETLTLPIAIEPTGRVRGLVRRADLAPAAGASVLFLLSEVRGVLRTQTEDDGTFDVEGIPLGSFDLRVEDPFTGGIGFANGLELSFEGEFLDNVVIDLDDSPVRVLSVDPPDGAAGVATNHGVRITFSDPVAALNGAFRIPGVSLAASLAPDGLSATLTGVLPDSRTLTVEVSTALVDLFGRRPVAPFSSTFRTVDLSPPKVVSTSPADGAFEVSGAAVLMVSFDEPLGGDTDFATLVSLVGPGGPVAGMSERVSPAEARFTPAMPLGDNTLYQVIVNGAVDDVGNTQTIPATVARFATHDTVAPMLSLVSPPASSWVSNPRPGIQVTTADNASGIAPSTAMMKLDGVLVPATVVGTSIVFAPASNLVEEEHPVEAAIADRAGNLGAFSGSFSIDVTPPSAAEIASPAAGTTLAGIIRFRAEASDLPSGVTRIDLRANGSFFTSLLGPSFEKDFDTSSIPEGDALLTARAVDRAGNAGPEGAPVPVKVDNRKITVSFFTPAQNLRVRDFVDVWVAVSEPVVQVELQIGSVQVVDTTAPYQATLDLTGVAEGQQQIVATAIGLADTGSASRAIVIDRTPPPPPDPDRVFAEPPQTGASLVHGLAGAVEAKALVAAVNLDTGASTTTSAGAVGSFALSLAASIGDVVALTAEDDLGNRSGATSTIVRSIPSLPPSEDAARLRFDGVVADRVGLDSLAPDGELDAVFTVMLSLGDGVTRTLDHIDLDGQALRSTRASAGAVLGVSASAGGPLRNDADGEVSFDLAGSASLTLFAADAGFVAEDETYTVTIVFTDGALLVGRVTIVPDADERGVPHSVAISASPETVVVASGVEGTTLLTLEDIRDVEGTPVPDGSRIAVAVADMAAVDPFGNPIRSAGGRLLDGEQAQNHAAFRVFAINGGSVVTSYQTDTVVPGAIAGAHVVVQVLAADEQGNVLGNEAIGTLDLNVRSASDRALFFVDGGSLYADQRPRLRSFLLEVRDAVGVLVPDGTKVLVSAASCAGRIAGVCIDSFGGTILGGFPSPSGTQYRYFETLSGVVTGEYQTPATAVPPGEVRFAALQAVPATATGAIANQNALGSARIALVGAGGAEIDLAPASVPIVLPERPVQVRVRHVHDARANLVPDDAMLILSSASCATRDRAGACTPSDGGAITDGAASSEGVLFRVFSLAGGAVNATYEARSVNAQAGEIKLARIQVAMSDAAGRRVNQTRIGVRDLPLLAPAHAVGSADPPSLLADGRLRTASVRFSPVIDAFGNPLPDGARVLVSAAHGEGRLDGAVIPSVFGASILNGEVPAFSAYRIFAVEGGAVTAVLGIDNVVSSVGRIQEANVVLLVSGPANNIVDREVLGVVPVKLPGITSGLAAASPAALEADGSDRRSVVTVTNLRDALGSPVPDGSLIGVSAAFCAARSGGICINPDVAAAIAGGESLPSLPAAYRAFQVQAGQIVVEVSTAGINVSASSRTAIVQVVSIQTNGALANPQEAIAGVEVELVRPGVDRVEASPLGLFASGASGPSGPSINDALSSIAVKLGAVPDGAQVALTATNCAAESATGACIASEGGTILPAGLSGTSPGDGEPANGDPRFRLFTVTGGEVKAVYSSSGIVAVPFVAETKIARVSVVAADGSGNVTSPQALATGEVHLRGATAATANGPSSARLTGGRAKITFAGIRDALGNTVPDGTVVLATAANCGTFLVGTTCNVSVGGTLLDGAVSPSGSHFRAYTVTAGSITVTYSTAGASLGTAQIQIAPATTGGTLIGTRSLLGGVHQIQVTSP